MNIVNDQYTQFLPKVDPELPPFFSVTFDLRNGSKISFEAIDCMFVPGSQCFQVISTDEEVKVIPRDVISQVIYDKRYLKIIEIKKRLEAEEAKRRKENSNAKEN